MIKSLTSLRGIFILFIFFHHCLDLYPGGGTMAVAFFFVLGGFSMTLGYKEKVLSTDFSFKQYITRRCIKFYPLHWLCLLAALPFALITFNVRQIPLFFVNATLLQSWIPIKDVYFSYNSVSWYLADTLFFTLAFPFVIRWIVRASIPGRIFIGLLFVLIYVSVVFLVSQQMHHAILYINPCIRLADFIFGIYIALLYFRIKEKPAKWRNGTIVSQLLVISLIVLLVVESCILSDEAKLIAPVYWVLISFVILVASLSGRIGGGRNLLENKILQRIGELSFIIFMIHQLVLRYSTIAFEKIFNFENIIIYIAFTLVFTIILSIVIERFILKPITKWLTEKIQPSMTAHS